MFPTRLLTLASALLSASLVHAAPKAIQPVSFEVYAPHITYPDASAVWAVGDIRLVKWDTNSLDDAGKNSSGVLFLGYMNPDDETDPNEHLYIDRPLASNFKLGDGQVNATVFDVPTRNSYIVVLLGDSANRSPKFTINGSNSSSSATPTESAVVVAPTPSA